LRIPTHVATLGLLGGVLASTLFPQAAFATEAGVVLELGSTGASVSTLQTDLQELGYFPGNEGITQYFGPVTSHAVISFKKDHKMGVTDRVTEKVFSVIQHIAAHAPRKASLAQSLGMRIAQKAEAYLGDPYVWGGVSPSGFDCSGYTQYIFAQFGIALPHSADGQAQLGVPINKADLAPGDLVFFDTGGGVSHVGIYIGDGRFINAASTKVEIDYIDDPYYWGSRYLFARRLT